MKSDGWDTNQPMKWGFFFCDEDKDKLPLVFAELLEKNYKLEDIYQVEENADSWTLHVSKTDTLTPEMLYRRNVAFNELADYCNIELYDGWDVERLS